MREQAVEVPEICTEGLPRLLRCLAGSSEDKAVQQSLNMRANQFAHKPNMVVTEDSSKLRLAMLQVLDAEAG